MKYVGWLSAVAFGIALFAGWHYFRNDELIYIHHAAAESAPHAAAAEAPVNTITSTSLRIPVSPELPDLPVSVNRRASAVGRGFVGVVQNNGSNYLRLSATYKNVTSGKTTTVDVEVAQNAAVELGWLEKCPIATGDTLTLSHPNFKAKTWEF